VIDTDTEAQFYDIVLRRSQENFKSFELLYQNGLYGNCVSILRQELDSYLRVLFLKVAHKRTLFMHQTLNGIKWHYFEDGKKHTVTDRMILDSLDWTTSGWERMVYDLGCAFIHLSNFHNYATENPFQTLSKIKKPS
jgi:hypothetical protein